MFRDDDLNQKRNALKRKNHNMSKSFIKEEEIPKNKKSK